jgi:hypothetical protein
MKATMFGSYADKLSAGGNPSGALAARAMSSWLTQNKLTNTGASIPTNWDELRNQYNEFGGNVKGPGSEFGLDIFQKTIVEASEAENQKNLKRYGIGYLSNVNIPYTDTTAQSVEFMQRSIETAVRNTNPNATQDDVNAALARLQVGPQAGGDVAGMAARTLTMGSIAKSDLVGLSMLSSNRTLYTRTLMERHLEYEHSTMLNEETARAVTLQNALFASAIGANVGTSPQNQTPLTKAYTAANAFVSFQSGIGEGQKTDILPNEYIDIDETKGKSMLGIIGSIGGAKKIDEAALQRLSQEAGVTDENDHRLLRYTSAGRTMAYTLNPNDVNLMQYRNPIGEEIGGISRTWGVGVERLGSMQENAAYLPQDVAQVQGQAANTGLYDLLSGQFSKKGGASKRVRGRPQPFGWGGRFIYSGKLRPGEMWLPPESRKRMLESRGYRGDALKSKMREMAMGGSLEGFALSFPQGDPVNSLAPMSLISDKEMKGRVSKGWWKQALSPQLAGFAHVSPHFAERGQHDFDADMVLAMFADPNASPQEKEAFVELSKRGQLSTEDVLGLTESQYQDRGLNNLVSGAVKAATDVINPDYDVMAETIRKTGWRPYGDINEAGLDAMFGQIGAGENYNIRHGIMGAMASAGYSQGRINTVGTGLQAYNQMGVDFLLRGSEAQGVGWAGAIAKSRFEISEFTGEPQLVIGSNVPGPGGKPATNYVGINGLDLNQTLDAASTIIGLQMAPVSAGGKTFTLPNAELMAGLWAAPDEEQVLQEKLKGSPVGKWQDIIVDSLRASVPTGLADPTSAKGKQDRAVYTKALAARPGFLAHFVSATRKALGLEYEKYPEGSEGERRQRSSRLAAAAWERETGLGTMTKAGAVLSLFHKKANIPAAMIKKTIESLPDNIYRTELMTYADRLGIPYNPAEKGTLEELPMEVQVAAQKGAGSNLTPSQVYASLSNEAKSAVDAYGIGHEMLPEQALGSVMKTYGANTEPSSPWEKELAPLDPVQRMAFLDTVIPTPENEEALKDQKFLAQVKYNATVGRGEREFDKGINQVMRSAPGPRSTIRNMENAARLAGVLGERQSNLPPVPQTPASVPASQPAPSRFSYQELGPEGVRDYAVRVDASNKPYIASQSQIEDEAKFPKFVFQQQAEDMQKQLMSNDQWFKQAALSPEGVKAYQEGRKEYVAELERVKAHIPTGIPHQKQSDITKMGPSERATRTFHDTNGPVAQHEPYEMGDLLASLGGGGFKETNPVDEIRDNVGSGGFIEPPAGIGTPPPPPPPPSSPSGSDPWIRGVSEDEKSTVWKVRASTVPGWTGTATNDAGQPVALLRQNASSSTVSDDQRLAQYEAALKNNPAFRIGGQTATDIVRKAINAIQAVGGGQENPQSVSEMQALQDELVDAGVIAAPVDSSGKPVSGIYGLGNAISKAIDNPETASRTLEIVQRHRPTINALSTAREAAKMGNVASPYARGFGSDPSIQALIGNTLLDAIPGIGQAASEASQIKSLMAGMGTDPERLASIRTMTQGDENFAELNRQIKLARIDDPNMQLPDKAARLQEIFSNNPELRKTAKLVDRLNSGITGDAAKRAIEPEFAATASILKNAELADSTLFSEKVSKDIQATPEVKRLVEARDAWRGLIEQVKESITTVKEGSAEHKKYTQSLKDHEAQLESVEKQLAPAMQEARRQSLVSQQADLGAKLLREGKLSPDELTTLGKTTEELQGIEREQKEAGRSNIGRLARRALGGFGLMYMRSIMGIMTQGVGEGFEEREALGQQIYGYAGKMLGGVTPYTSAQQRLVSAMAQSGAGATAQYGMKMLGAEMPGIRGAGNALIAGIAGAGATSWLAEMAGFSIGGPALAGIGALVGGASLLASGYASSKDPTGSGLAIAKSRYEGQMGIISQLNPFRTDVGVNIGQVFNRMRATSFGDEAPLRQDLRTQNLYNATRSILDGKRTYQTQQFDKDAPGRAIGLTIGGYGLAIGGSNVVTTTAKGTTIKQLLSQGYSAPEVAAVMANAASAEYGLTVDEAIYGATFYTQYAGTAGLNQNKAMYGWFAAMGQTGIDAQAGLGKVLQSMGMPLGDIFGTSGKSSTLAQTITTFGESQIKTKGRGKWGINELTQFNAGAEALAQMPSFRTTGLGKDFLAGRQTKEQERQLMELTYNVGGMDPRSQQYLIAQSQYYQTGTRLGMDMGVNPLTAPLPSNISATQLVSQQMQTAAAQGIEARQANIGTAAVSSALMRGDTRQARMMAQGFAQLPPNQLGIWEGVLNRNPIAMNIAAERGGFDLANTQFELMNGSTRLGSELFKVDTRGGIATGLAWGTSSIASGMRGGANAQQMAEQIYGAGWQNNRFMAASANGVNVPGVGNIGGALGAQWENIQVSYQQAMASAGLQFQGIALNKAFTTGVGIEKYAGAINPQTGQPFGINTGKFSWNAGSLGSFTSQGGGQWGLEDANRALGIAQQTESFAHQQKALNIGAAQFAENFAMNKKQAMMQRTWSQEDWQYQATTRELGWQWRQEDYAEESRFMTGRQRRLAERGMKRETTMHNIEEDQITKTQNRQKELWKLEDQRFQIQQKQFKENQKMAQEDLDNAKTFWKIKMDLEEQGIKLARANWVEQIKLQERSAGLAAASAKASKDAAEQQWKLNYAQMTEKGLLQQLLDEGLNPVFASILNFLSKVQGLPVGVTRNPNAGTLPSVQSALTSSVAVPQTVSPTGAQQVNVYIGNEEFKGYIVNTVDQAIRQ